jgi:hypothetical protein
MRFPLFSFEDRSCELDPLTAILNAGSKKQRTQMLFHGPGANVQLLRDFLVTAPFDQQVQNLFIALRNLNVAKIQHGFLSAWRALTRLFLIGLNPITQRESK